MFFLGGYCPVCLASPCLAFRLEVTGRFGICHRECENVAPDGFESEIVTSWCRRLLQALAVGGGGLVSVHGRAAWQVVFREGWKMACCESNLVLGRIMEGEVAPLS